MEQLEPLHQAEERNARRVDRRQGLHALVRALATHLVAGEPQANPWRDLDWPAIPGHTGKPWFLPMVGAWFRVQDWLH